MIAALEARRARFGRLLRVLPFLALLAGCFETDEEIFPAGEGHTVAGLEGRYVADGATLTIARAAGGSDYRFTLLPKNDKPASGSFRLIPLKASLELVQAHLDGEPAGRFYHLLFFVNAKEGRVTSFERRDPDDEAAQALAARLGVGISGSTAAGAKPAVAQFLKGLAGLPLSRGENALYIRAD